ncbi:hypothetical protein, partial [Vibrio cholerae]|uniref:hypothetical protein n=1 Tax=Vibrio cholerae TaxID=666 RepID=UPI001C31A555
IFLIALLLLVIGSFGIHFKLLSESMMGIHIDDICLNIFWFRVKGYGRQEEGGGELLMRAYGLSVLRRKDNGVRMALLRKRIIYFICYSSSGNKPIKALSLGR